MKLGAERKKVVLLGGLLAVAGVTYYMNRDSGAAPRPTSAQSLGLATTPQGAPPVQKMPPPDLAKPAPRAARSASNQRRGGLEEFRPVLRTRRPEDRIDPMSVDPTLRVDLIVRLQNVKSERADRSLFEFSQPPAPKNPDPPKVKPGPIAAAPKPEATEAAKTEAAKPKPPPITLKFYGMAADKRQGPRRAFFLDGDDILVAAEGELVKKRYKIVRINVSSVVVADTQFQNNEQTLPIEEPQQQS
jgi:hypothetical protein